MGHSKMKLLVCDATRRDGECLVFELLCCLMYYYSSMRCVVDVVEQEQVYQSAGSKMYLIGRAKWHLRTYIIPADGNTHASAR